MMMMMMMITLPVVTGLYFINKKLIILILKVFIYRL